MITIIAGSRDIPNPDFLHATLDYWDYTHDWYPTLVVSGGARGADSIGEEWAKGKGIEIVIYTAKWDKYGKSAGYRRNVEMAENAEALIAFWDGESRGTKHMIDTAKKKGLIVGCYCMKKHLFIPDTQIKEGVCINHLNALGHYIIDQQPEIIVMAGDWADMHSLSSYDMGRKSGEGARYENDIVASRRAMDVLFAPINAYNAKKRRNKEKLYSPRYALTLGNHENRINRHVEAYPVLEGRLSTDDLGYKDYGWEVLPFLHAEEIDGILYSHFFPRNAQGRVMQGTRGSPSAATQVRREMQSCTSGHLQGLDWHAQQTGTRRHYGLIAGSFYMHEEDYLGPQGTAYWRGVVVKHEVENGSYDPMFVSMDYLLKNWWDGEDRYA